MNSLTIRSNARSVIMPDDLDKHAKYRLGRFCAWLDAQGQIWYEPDLAAYRDAMLAEGKATSTVSAHLSTVRARYARLRDDLDLRDVIETAVREALQAQDEPHGLADVEAGVNRLFDRLASATSAKKSEVKQVVRQDVPDAEHLRLSAEQASALMASPGTDTLPGLRDTAVIAMLLCTGVREAELCALEVRDLRQQLGGELALHVREGKGRKRRLIPYGELDWVLVIVDRWLAAAGIESGAVFKGLYKGGKSLRPGALSVRAIEYVLQSYPLAISGELVQVRPHDARRTYARRLYDAGVDLVAIQQNLGHKDPKTTLKYIGTLDAERRRAPAVYTFDLTGLYQQDVLKLR